MAYIFSSAATTFYLQ